MICHIKQGKNSNQARYFGKPKLLVSLICKYYYIVLVIFLLFDDPPGLGTYRFVTMIVAELNISISGTYEKNEI